MYMDGTFKCAPKKFYQLYNIIGKDEKSSIVIPLIFILMLNKSFDLYLHIFLDILDLCWIGLISMLIGMINM